MNIHICAVKITDINETLHYKIVKVPLRLINVRNTVRKVSEYISHCNCQSNVFCVKKHKTIPTLFSQNVYY